jgi:hypothetical protein
MECNKLVFSGHIISQMFKRNISVDDILGLLEKGEIIMTYPDDKPYPSYLMLGYQNKRPLHLVVAKDEQTGQCIAVTIYEPDNNAWSPDFKSKIK